MLLHPRSRDRVQRLGIDRIKDLERILLFPRILRFGLVFFIQLQPPRLLRPHIPRRSTAAPLTRWLLPLLESVQGLLPVHVLPGGPPPTRRRYPQGSRLLTRDPSVWHLQRRGQVLERDARSPILRSRPRSGPGAAPNSAWKQDYFSTAVQWCRGGAFPTGRFGWNRCRTAALSSSTMFAAAAAVVVVVGVSSCSHVSSSCLRITTSSIRCPGASVTTAIRSATNFHLLQALPPPRAPFRLSGFGDSGYRAIELRGFGALG